MSFSGENQMPGLGDGVSNWERVKELVDGKVFIGLTYKEILVVRLLAEARIVALEGEIDTKVESVVTEKRELLPVYKEIVRRINEREGLGG